MRVRKIETKGLPRFTTGNRRLAARAIRELNVARLALKVSREQIAKNPTSRNESVSILLKNESFCARPLVFGQHTSQGLQYRRINRERCAPDMNCVAP